MFLIQIKNISTKTRLTTEIYPPQAWRKGNPFLSTKSTKKHKIKLFYLRVFEPRPRRVNLCARHPPCFHSFRTLELPSKRLLLSMEVLPKPPFLPVSAKLAYFPGFSIFHFQLSIIPFTY